MTKSLSKDEIFHVAADLADLAQRSHYLDEACGDDSALRQEIEELLAIDGNAGSFLESPPIDNDDTLISPPADQVGAQIGPYKLLQKIGEGGMGVVYMAEQREPVRRRVALKIIKPGMDTKQVIARFEAERQTLAMMDHPNIARVLDAGATENGHPYFVMELVNGLPVTEYCDEQHLTPRERLELFISVCEAVQHAHQKGVIHRDLKPSNILVALYDGRPVPKVIDFGVAKATSHTLTEKTMFTEFGQLVGTLEYMSPEQAERNQLDVDTRSDIYSLGVVLYELLTGETPFDRQRLRSAGFDEMLRIIREEEPSRPSMKVSSSQSLPSIATNRRVEPTRLSAIVRGELDWIVMKSLEKDRGRRYASAGKFAEDLQHYLSDEPVEAAAPSTAYRLRKFADRHTAALGAASTMVLLLVGGIVATAMQAAVAESEKQNAIVALGKADEEKERANNERDRATAEKERADAARKEAEAVSKFLVDMFQRARPGEENGGRDLKVVEVLDDAVKELAQNESIPPERRATLQITLADSYYSLGLSKQAIPLLEQAYKLRREVLGEKHAETFYVMRRLAMNYRQVGRAKEALPIAQQVLAAHRETKGPKDTDTLYSMSVLSICFEALGNEKEALKLREQVLKLQQEVNGPKHERTILAMNALQLSYLSAERKEEALELATKALSLSKEVRGEEHPGTLSLMNNLAAVYSSLNRMDEALKLQEKVLELDRKIKGPEHSSTLTSMLNLAAAYRFNDRFDEALKLNQETLRLNVKVHGEDHPQTISAMRGLVTVYYKIHDKQAYPDGNRPGFHPGTPYPPKPLQLTNESPLQRAIDYSKEALALAKKVHGPKHPTTLDCMLETAQMIQTAGLHDEAVAIGRKWRDLYLEVNGSTRETRAASALKFSNILASAGRDESFQLTVNDVMRPMLDHERRLFIRRNKLAAQFERYMSPLAKQETKNEFAELLKTKEGKEQLLEVYLAVVNSEYADGTSSIGKLFAKARASKPTGSIAMWTIPHDQELVGYFFIAKRTNGPGFANGMMHSPKWARELQELLVNFRDFRHPDYPEFTFTVYAKNEECPEFIDWNDFEGVERVLVVEPTEAE